MVYAGDDSGDSTEKLIIQVSADDCTDIISRLCDFVDERTCHANGTAHQPSVAVCPDSA